MAKVKVYPFLIRKEDEIFSLLLEKLSCFQVNSQMVNKLLTALNECTEWGQVSAFYSLLWKSSLSPVISTIYDACVGRKGYSKILCECKFSFLNASQRGKEREKTATNTETERDIERGRATEREKSILLGDRYCTHCDSQKKFD